MLPHNRRVVIAEIEPAICRRSSLARPSKSAHSNNRIVLERKTQGSTFKYPETRGLDRMPSTSPQPHPVHGKRPWFLLGVWITGHLERPHQCSEKTQIGRGRNRDIILQTHPSSSSKSGIHGIRNRRQEGPEAVDANVRGPLR